MLNSASLVAVRHLRQIMVFTLRLWVLLMILLAVSCSTKGLKLLLILSRILCLMNKRYCLRMRDNWTTFFWAVFRNKPYLSTLERCFLKWLSWMRVRVRDSSLLVSFFLRFFRICCWFLMYRILYSISSEIYRSLGSKTFLFPINF